MLLWRSALFLVNLIVNFVEGCRGREPDEARFRRRSRLSLRRRKTALVLGAITCAGCLAAAPLPVTRLTSVFPPGARLGSTVEVNVTGIDLDDLTQLVFSHTNITAVSNAGQKFVVAVSSNVPPGVYDARALGRYGLSNPRAFAVSDWPELVETSGNSTSSNAMEVPIGSVMNGQADPNAADYFKLVLRSGQRVFIECAATALDSRCLPRLFLYEDAGLEIARDRTGSLLDFTAPRDMGVVLKVHDALFRGGPDYVYRLLIHDGPHIDFILPAAALPGTTNKHVVYGRNLPGGRRSQSGDALEEIEIELEAPPANAISNRNTDTLVRAHSIESVSVTGFEYRLAASNGMSNPLFIGAATAPLVLETEPNSKPGEAQKITPPCEVSGQFHPANDHDWFQFPAKKGEAYWIEIFSERLGCPTDPFVLVQRVATNGAVADVKELYDGEAITVGEARVETRDPAWRMEVSEDGVCRLQVRDLFNRIESNPRHIYRLAVRRGTPGFDLLACSETPLPINAESKDLRICPSFLRRGETIALRLTALRRGYGDEIKIEASGLPSGVRASEVRIPAGKTSALLLLSAADDAPAWAGSIDVAGVGRAAGQEIKRAARGATLVHAVEDKTKEPVQARLSATVLVSVSSNELAPIRITAADDKIYEAGPTGKISIRLTVKRNGDFTEAVKLKPGPSSALESLSEFEVPAKGTNATVEIDLAKHKLTPGEHVLFFRGQAKGKYRRNPEAVTLAEEQLKAAEKLAADLAAEVKKAEAALATASPETKPSENLTELRARLKETETQKTAADAALKQATEKAKPQDVTLTVYSEPIRLRVTEEKKVASTDKK
jgi:hypothetical protein